LSAERVSGAADMRASPAAHGLAESTKESDMAGRGSVPVPGTPLAEEHTPAEIRRIAAGLP